MKILKICSLFAGCGGLDLGFEQAKNPKFNFKVIWANDFDKSACDTYKKNFSDTEVICSDIWDYDLKKMPDCDVILGGFPCQDFSVLRGNGKRKGVDVKRGLLYTKFVEAVELKKPIIFVAENVKGLLSANEGYAITRIREDFAKLGYDVKINLVKFVEYGVPQKRERVVIIGLRKDIDGNFEPLKLMEKQQGKNAKEALAGVEQAFYNNELLSISSEVVEMLKSVPPGGNYKHIPKYSKNRWMSLIYRRLHPDEPSPTLVACGGGGTWGYHYSEPRSLTNRERARLQTFPDNFVFEGSTTQVRKQIGNAVPPEGARRIAEAILKHLENKI
jgi:DNA (cytosine-5)-methyltransferase 1